MQIQSRRDQSPVPTPSQAFGQAFGGPRQVGRKRSLGNVSSSSDSGSDDRAQSRKLPLPKRQLTAPSTMSRASMSTHGPPPPAPLQRSSTMGGPRAPSLADLMKSANNALVNAQAGQLQALGYTVPSNVNRLPTVSGQASAQRPPVTDRQRRPSSRSATNSPSPPLSKHASRENLRPAGK